MVFFLFLFGLKVYMLIMLSAWKSRCTRGGEGVGGLGGAETLDLWWCFILTSAENSSREQWAWHHAETSGSVETPPLTSSVFVFVVYGLISICLGSFLNSFSSIFVEGCLQNFILILYFFCLKTFSLKRPRVEVFHRHFFNPPSSEREHGVGERRVTSVGSEVEVSVDTDRSDVAGGCLLCSHGSDRRVRVSPAPPPGRGMTRWRERGA